MWPKCCRPALTDDEVAEVKAWLDKAAAAATAAAAAAARHRLRLPRRADAGRRWAARSSAPTLAAALARASRQRRGDAAGGRRAECAARPERGGEGSGSDGGSSNHWANPDWYTDTKLLAYFDSTQTSGWDTRAVDLGPNGNDITYNAYGNAQGTVEYIQTPTSITSL